MATVILNVTQLQAMENDLAADYELGRDIDASATVDWNGGAGFLPIGQAGAFTGQLDGKGHKVTDLCVNRPGNEVGLFKEIGGAGVVKNIGLKDCDIVGKGACLAYRNDGEIDRCYATGVAADPTASWVAGLVVLNNGVISECRTDVAVDASANGGSGGDAGGLVGDNGGTITDCYARGDVTAAGYAGGLVQLNSGTVVNCYSTGSVSGGSGAGGLIEDNSGTVTNSFWDTEASGQAASDGGTGKTTAQMKSVATFQAANWAISRVWNVVAGCNAGYPCLINVDSCCIASESPTVDRTVAESKVSLEAVRNLEIVYGGRAYVGKAGNFVYESRYHRHV